MAARTNAFKDLVQGRARGLRVDHNLPFPKARSILPLSHVLLFGPDKNANDRGDRGEGLWGFFSQVMSVPSGEPDFQVTVSIVGMLKSSNPNNQRMQLIRGQSSLK
jgi:hypothetical protein